MLECGAPTLPKWKILYLLGLVYFRFFSYKINRFIYKVYSFRHYHIWDVNLRCVICKKTPYEMNIKELEMLRPLHCGLSKKEIQRLKIIRIQNDIANKIGINRKKIFGKDVK
jgi:hypothetical protein